MVANRSSQINGVFRRSSPGATFARLSIVIRSRPLAVYLCISACLPSFQTINLKLSLAAFAEGKIYDSF